MKNILSILFANILFVLFSCNNAQQDNPTEAVKNNSDQTESVSRGQSGVVDDVSQKNVVQIAAGSADHSTLVAAVKAGELVDALSNAGPFTVFAPTNEAFNKLPAGTVDNLLKPENKESLQNILQYHVSVGGYKMENFSDGQILGQVNGDNVKMTVKNGKVMVNDAQIIASIPASNGIIHVIDGVLLPPKK